MRRTYPNQGYYLGLDALRLGELRDAFATGIDARQSSRRDLGGFWIDSTPIFTLLGEAAYQTGDLPDAHRQFEQAISIALQRWGWLNSVNWSASAAQSQVASTNRIPWAAQQSVRPRADLPDFFQVNMGTLDPSNAIQQGGTFQTAHVLLVDVVEVVRSLAWALYRRGEILGYGSQTDPLVDDLLKALTNEPVGTSELHRASISLLLGMAASARGEGRAAAAMESAAYLSGQFEHPLTPLACLGIARESARGGNLELASRWAWEAAAAAARWEQPELLAPALQLALAPSIANGDPLAVGQAADVATFYERVSPLVSAYAYSLAAEAAVAAQQLEQATNLLGRGVPFARVRNRPLPRAAWHHAYADAALQMSLGRGDLAIQRMEEPLAAMQGLGGRPVGSATIFQIRLAEEAIKRQALGPRSVEQVTSALLVDPPVEQWIYQPLEAWAVLASDLEGLERARIQAALKRQNPEAVIRYADALQRRHAFHVFPWQGRATGLRWLMSAPADQLPPALVKTQQALAAGPMADIAQRLQQLAADRAAALAEPMKVNDEQLAATMAMADEAETLLSRWVFRRSDWPRVFPLPLASETDPKLPLPPAGKAILTFVPGTDGLVGMSLSREGLHAWPVERGDALSAEIAMLLESLGVGRKRAGAQRLPDGDSHRDLSRKIFRRLIPDSEQSLLRQVEELVVVPWGPLWNLPFELCQLTGDDQLLMQRLRLRYAPTVGLAVHGSPAPALRGKTLGIGGRLFSPRDGKRQTEQEQRLIDAAPDSLRVPASSPTASRWLRGRGQVFWVADLVDVDPNQLFQTRPFGASGKSDDDTLAAWQELPLVGPELLLMPGARTDAERSLGRRAGGEDLFALACGLQAAGCPTAVISRWPVGGASTADLLTTFLKELPHEPTTKAWQYAVLALQQQTLDPKAEPILSVGDQGLQPAEGSQPLFWAGYLLIDCRIEAVAP